MIFHLLDQIVKAKPAGFPNMAVGALAAGTATQIALYPGDLIASKSVRDVSSETRPQPWREDIAVVKGTVAYKLAKTPLAGTISCSAVYTNYVSELVETDDFSFDEKTPAIDLTAAGQAKLNAANVLRAAYSFAGVQGKQEFTQTFFADVQAASFQEAEQWSSLLASLALMNHDSFVQAVNDQSNGYQSGDFTARSVLSHFGLSQTTTNAGTGGVTIHLSFEAKGQLELTYGKADFGLIRQVVGPDRTGSTKVIDIGTGVA